MKVKTIKVIIGIIIVLFISFILCGFKVSAAVGDIGEFRVTANSGLRLRDYPVNGNIITCMPKNSTINITSWNGEWAYGTFGSYSGWCSGQYITNESIQESTSYKGNLRPLGSFKITGYLANCSGTGLTCTGVRADTVVGTCCS